MRKELPKLQVSDFFINKWMLLAGSTDSGSGNTSPKPQAELRINKSKVNPSQASALAMPFWVNDKCPRAEAHVA